MGERCVADLAALITAITGAIVAILGAIGGLVVTLRRVSPKERADAVANTSSDDAQDQRIAELEARLRRLASPDEES